MSMIDHDDIDRMNDAARERAENSPRVTRRADGKVFRIVAQARSPDGPVDLAAVSGHPIERVTVNGLDFARDFIDPRKPAHTAQHTEKTMSTGIGTDNGMTFGAALALLKRGVRVARAGWNGKGMWLGLQTPDAHSKMTLPYIYMSTVTGDLVPWIASQTDILANDWTEVES